eukprot:jgi/Bigna1/147415/aug1.147_g22123
MNTLAAGRFVNRKETVVRYEPIELKIRDATSNEPWGAPNTLLAEIARATHDNFQYKKLFAMVWKRFKHDGIVLHVQKAMILIEYLLKNGSNRFILDVRTRMEDIRDKKDNYKARGKKLKDIERVTQVKRKAARLLRLITDEDLLLRERQVAERLRNMKQQSAVDCTSFDPFSYPIAEEGMGGKAEETSAKTRDEIAEGIKADSGVCRERKVRSGRTTKSAEDRKRGGGTKINADFRGIPHHDDPFVSNGGATGVGGGRGLESSFDEDPFSSNASKRKGSEQREEEEKAEPSVPPAPSPSPQRVSCGGGRADTQRKALTNNNFNCDFFDFEDNDGEPPRSNSKRKAKGARRKAAASASSQPPPPASASAGGEEQDPGLLFEVFSNMANNAEAAIRGDEVSIVAPPPRSGAAYPFGINTNNDNSNDNSNDDNHSPSIAHTVSIPSSGEVNTRRGRRRDRERPVSKLPSNDTMSSLFAQQPVISRASLLSSAATTEPPTTHHLVSPFSVPHDNPFIKPPPSTSISLPPSSQQQQSLSQSQPRVGTKQNSRGTVGSIGSLSKQSGSNGSDNDSCGNGSNGGVSASHAQGFETKTINEKARFEGDNDGGVVNGNPFLNPMAQNAIRPHTQVQQRQDQQKTMIKKKKKKPCQQEPRPRPQSLPPQSRDKNDDVFAELFDF